MSMELPKAFETFLLVIAGLLFYLAYQHTSEPWLLWLGIGLALVLIIVAVALWYWRTEKHYEYLGSKI